MRVLGGRRLGGIAGGLWLAGGNVVEEVVETVCAALCGVELVPEVLVLLEDGGGDEGELGGWGLGAAVDAQRRASCSSGVWGGGRRCAVPTAATGAGGTAAGLGARWVGAYG